MCGIFAIVTRYVLALISKCQKAVAEGKTRGPEYSRVSEHEFPNGTHVVLGFNRLAINGLTEQGNQPFVFSGINSYATNNVTNANANANANDVVSEKMVYLVCNGEIYNHEELEIKYGFMCNTGSDCEVIGHMYMKFGIEFTLSQLHGVFAFVLVDISEQIIYSARDRLGIRPLFYGSIVGLSPFVAASEMKQLRIMDSPTNHVQNVRQQTPGTVIEIRFDRMDQAYLKETAYWSVYSCFMLQPYFTNTTGDEVSDSSYRIYRTLQRAIDLRVHNTERPIGCLLSGGLDSSLVAAMVAKSLKSRARPHNKQPERLNTFSIGIAGSEDLYYAKMVADHIGSTHHELVVTEQEMFDSIPYVVTAIQSFDITSVRASVGNWLVAKYIAEYTDIKVVFNGDGADELMGGYQYFNILKTDDELHLTESLRLLKNIHHYDVLRSDRCIACHGLEARTPFLDQDFVKTYLTEYTRQRMRCWAMGETIEKAVIRNIISAYQPDLLPREVLWRRKEAFSDGVSGKTRSWTDAINELIVTRKIDKEPIVLRLIRKYGFSAEGACYCMLFMRNYDFDEIPEKDPFFEPSYAQQLQTMWMPRFTNVTDPSARKLPNYNKQ